MRFLSVLLAGALLLAGCAGAPEEVVPEVASSEPVNDTLVNATVENETVAEPAAEKNVTEPEPNRPPVAILDADVINGTAPLMVNITIDGADLDEDALTWTLTINGSKVATGERLPVTINHTFPAGEHVVELRITDGEDAAVETLHVTAHAPPPVPQEVVLQHVAGAWLVGAPGCAASYPDWVRGVAHGVAVYEFDIDPATVGKQFRAVLDGAGTTLGLGIDFYNSAGVNIEAVYELGQDVVLEGAIPDDAAFAFAYKCGDRGGSVDYVAYELV